MKQAWRLGAALGMAACTALACSDGPTRAGTGVTTSSGAAGAAGAYVAVGGRNSAAPAAGAQFPSAAGSTAPATASGTAAAGAAAIGGTTHASAAAGNSGMGGVAGAAGSAPSTNPDAPSSDAGHVVPEPEDDARYVFDQSSLRTYNIIVAESDLALIDMDPAAEMYINAMLEFEGKTIGPISMRYKGSVGGFLPPCTDSTLAGSTGAPQMSQSHAKTGKCSIKLDFDRVDSSLRFYGLKKLNFHSMDRDKSMLRDRLGYAMFRESGVAAPRAAHARVLINGRLEGLYIVVEQIDGRFTHSRFSDGGDGNLYKEVWPVSDTANSYIAALETNDDQPTAAQVDKMVRFHAAIAQGADASFGWLDSSYLFNYIAVDRVITNDDGAFHWYCQWNHNYYWYEGERADRVWLIPWDLDSSFQNGTFVHIETPWNTPAANMSCSCSRSGQRAAICDPLIAAWAGRSADYTQAVDRFIAGPFNDANVSAKLAAWTSQIDPVVQEAAGVQGAPTYMEWQEAFANLQAIIASSRTHRGYAYDTMMKP